MSREIYISSTPHETRLAIVEKDELNEIYYERENEYTLAGSIYNGRVTRVLPGMQSAFVDIGLERDAFLYITDFMEEQGEAADFESGESRGGGRRDRGRGKRDEEGSDASEASGEGDGEGRRDRGRNRRGDRPQREAAGDEQSVSAPEEDNESSEGASEAGEGGAAEGSRRWRGRRGRRRGRGGNDEQRTAAPAAETQDAGTEEESEGGFETQEPQGERQEQRGEGRGRDRGRRGRDGRGDRSGRFDRSDRPARTSSASDESEDTPAGPSAEPFILPGESLSKYRRGEEPAASETAASHQVKPQPANLVTSKPSTEAAPILGWDGGLTLPGETLSRHRDRGNEPAQEAAAGDSEQSGGRDRRRERDRKRGSGGREEGSAGRRELDPAEAVLPAVTSQHEPEAAFQPLTDDAPDFEVAETEERIHRQAEEHAQQVEEILYEAQTDLAPASEETPVHVLEAVEEFHETVAEYEPGNEASASYRVDPSGPSEFRQNAPLTEEEEIAEVRFDEDHGMAAAEPEVIHVQSTGEMIAEEPLIPEAEATRNEVLHPTSPMEHEGAIRASEPAEAETAPAPGLFAPGDGELEEELLDDDDSDPLTLHAGAFEDTEEETLEHTGDLGSMIREMSIDSITRPEAIDEDEDDFDIDEEEMEEDELESDGEEAEGFAGSDISEGEEEEFAEGGEFEEGEEAAGEVAAAAPAREPRTGEERRPRRDGRRGRDRNGRDRRGMANSRSGGRPGRHSVQATDLPAISDLLKPGQEVLVQIAKEPIAKKGARITSHIALPGRFLVFMPTVNHVGVSRKIESDGERRRLKEILLSEKGEASGGFIVRTAASGASEDELRSDLRFLLNLWADIKQRSDSSKSPALIYHDLNLVERVLRDQVSDSFSAIWVDTESEYERVLRFLQRFQPSLIRRVKLYTKETPLFEQFGITNEINKALRSKVWLKSGGSIVINQTEALVAIDINTGKYVGKTARLEDTIVKTNLDAIPEIVRQIRLRDLGGIIIIDFIDMDERKNRQKVMQALEEELKKDRAPSKVLQFNDFGLVAITRKRVKQSLERTLSTTCGICAGTGMVKSPVTVCNEIYIELRKIQKHLDKGDVMLRVNPEVVKQLKSGNGKWLQEMEEIAGKTILIKSDPTLHPEQFEIH